MKETKRHLERSEFNELAWVHLVLLRLLGLVAFDSRSPNFWPSRLLCLFMYSCNILVTSMYTCCIARSLISTGRADVQVVAECVGLCGVHLRFLITYANRKRLEKLLNEARKLWLELTDQEKCLLRSAQVTRYYLSVCAGHVLLYVVPDLIRFLLNDIRLLPFPFYGEVTASPGYEISFFMQTIGLIGICVAASGIDTTVLFLIMFASGYSNILGTRFSSIAKRCEGHANGPFVYKEMINVTQCHQRIIEFCERMSEITSPLFMVLLICTTYTMSLIGLKIVGTDPDKYKGATVLIIYVVQLFTCNWAPDVLATESGALDKSVYFLTTTDQNDKEISKLLNIVMMRSQRPIQLTVAGYVNLSMECFSSMITSAVSFFTVLRSMK
ncbi:odorant receptor 30a-like [Copidosoma floridanum]|uniref:odorant receptor 30a-like n=1 Tax=Copidosoma floridanum TaxID=29053 RepID=UPI000C6FA4F4|nr:odorant receptor 30a-like [Copidosoma floridanum]